jgi:hypothetical protein
MRKILDLFAKSSIGLSENYKGLFDVANKLLTMGTSILRVGAQWSLMYKDKHTITPISLR